MYTYFCRVDRLINNMSDENIVTNLEARFTLDFRCKYCTNLEACFTLDLRCKYWNKSRSLFYFRFQM